MAPRRERGLCASQNSSRTQHRGNVKVSREDSNMAVAASLLTHDGGNPRANELEHFLRRKKRRHNDRPNEAQAGRKAFAFVRSELFQQEPAHVLEVNALLGNVRTLNTLEDRSNAPEGVPNRKAGRHAGIENIGLHQIDKHRVAENGFVTFEDGRSLRAVSFVV